MMRRAARTAASVLVLAAVTVGCAMTPQGSDTAPSAKSMVPVQQRHPNVLLVLIDDLGARDLGYMGSRYYETPNIDAFARSSAQFATAYAPSTVCSPSRAALLTGKDPARLGITTWIPGGEYQNQPLVEPSIPDRLATSETTLAEAFKAGGYRTFFAGKWHLGGPGALPTDQGFDINLGGGEWGQPRHGYFSPYGNPYLSDGPKGEYIEDRLTNETIKFLENAKGSDRPFFAFLSYYAVHTPIHAAPGGDAAHFRAKAAKMARKGQVAEMKEGIGRTKLIQDNADYASMIKAMDGNFGRVLAALDRLELSKNTIVVFTSDNGGLSTLDPAIPLYTNGTPTANAPFRAGKGWTYEGGIRVPLLIAGPGVKTHHINAPVSLTDIYPTLLDMANLPPPAMSDGISLRAIVAGARPQGERTFLWHFPHYHGSGSKPATAVRRGDWKLVHNYEPDSWELYDLRSDPSERQDLSRHQPTRLRALKDAMVRMIGQTGAQLPTRRNQRTN